MRDGVDRLWLKAMCWREGTEGGSLVEIIVFYGTELVQEALQYSLHFALRIAENNGAGRD